MPFGGSPGRKTCARDQKCRYVDERVQCCVCKPVAVGASGAESATYLLRRILLEQLRHKIRDRVRIQRGHPRSSSKCDRPRVVVVLPQIFDHRWDVGGGIYCDKVHAGEQPVLVKPANTQRHAERGHHSEPQQPTTTKSKQSPERERELEDSLSAAQRSAVECILLMRHPVVDIDDHRAA